MGSVKTVYFLVFVIALSACLQHDSRQRSDQAGSRPSAAADERYLLEKGQDYVSAAQSILAENLFEAIRNDGAPNALTFCNVHAMPLTDSLARAEGIQIKRVSDKNRNPGNSADARELEYILQGKAMIERGEPVKPKLMQYNGTNLAYYPILTMQSCLQCHGEPAKEILPATLAMIDSLYPDDNAKGYAVNELRGIWVVEWRKSH